MGDAVMAEKEVDYVFAKYGAKYYIGTIESKKGR